MKLQMIRVAAIALVCAGGLLGIQCLSAEEQSMRWPDAGPDAVPFEDVEFAVSSDPTVVVFSLVTTTGRKVRETLIYGDGRIELQRSNLWGPIEDLKTTVLETYELSISFDDVVSLIRIAVIHGLVESDPESLETKRRALGRRLMVSTTVSYRITVALEAYTRGGAISRTHVENIIWARDAPFMAAQYPEILEFQGFREVNAVVRVLWKRARAEEQDK